MPRWIYKLPLRFRSVFKKSRVENDLSDELHFHLEKQIEQNMASGMSAEEARYAALRSFGGVERVKEECRDSWGMRLVSEVVQDFRYGLRQLRRNPGFTAVAVLTLALGIGANTAIFSVFNAVLLRPLPFRNPGRLVVLGETDQRFAPSLGEVSYPNFLDWKEQNHVFGSLAVFHTATFTLIGHDEAQHIQGTVVSSDLFSLLGAPALLGRTFLPKEGQPGSQDSDRPVVLSYAFWNRYFGGSRTVLGRKIELDNHLFTVVGVMPAGFEFPITAESTNLWTTIGVDAVPEDGKPPVTAQRSTRYVQVIARLKPHVTLAQAQADMSIVAQRLARHYPGPDSNTGVLVVPEFQALVGNVRPALLILLGAVGILLLIACANVASLLLARTAERKREIAVRAALGAKRSRIVRQLVSESILLASLSSLIGLVIAVWGVHLMVALDPHQLPRIQHVSIDLRVLCFTVLAAVFSGLVFGLAPAITASRLQLSDALKKSGPAGGITQRNRLRNILVTGETALSLVLLISAGLLIQSLWRLMSVNPGFNPNRVLTFRVDLPSPQYSEAARIRFYQHLLGRLKVLPGVRSASAIEPLPLSGNNMACSFQIEGRPTPPGDYRNTDFHVVTPGYFHTMGIPLSNGRVFGPHDNLASTPVAIINRTLARRYFPHQNPIGKRIQPAVSNGYKAAPWREIVGIVGGVRDRGLSHRLVPEVYVPQAQSPMTMTVVVRTAIAPVGMTSAVRKTVKNMDKELPVYDIRTLQQYLAMSVADPRFSATLLGVFGAIALALAAAGLYGIISQSVAQSTHDIGIRLALGARKSDVLRMVVGQGLRLALIGVGIGVAAALALTRFLSSLLYGVKPTDPLIFIAVSLVLIAVAMLACYIPARRAAKVDPMVALRYE